MLRGANAFPLGDRKRNLDDPLITKECYEEARDTGERALLQDKIDQLTDQPLIGK